MFSGHKFFQGWIGMMQNLGLFLQVFGVFLLLDSKVKCHWWVGYGPTLLLSAGHPPPHWHNIFFLSDLFILFSLSAPHANISARWDHHKMGSSHCNFMLLSHTGKKWSPQWLRNMKVGEEKSLSFSSCLFSMEKLVPLNDHFLAISHSEKLLLRFSSRNLHFYTVWGYST